VRFKEQAKSGITAYSVSGSGDQASGPHSIRAKLPSNLAFDEGQDRSTRRRTYRPETRPHLQSECIGGSRHASLYQNRRL